MPPEAREQARLPLQVISFVAYNLQEPARAGTAGESKRIQIWDFRIHRRLWQVRGIGRLQI
jgi:hypothetical protein